ncbi:putative DUF221 domain protein [Tothia fuscella]|uniref:DUF221 domain protein n=1 Tax=Tothia fuscella TaxID=1048955 RepID=A0A9P4U164_9PEZI|nr:putative DUF221 domain protein [Tothia fuscella]
MSSIHLHAALREVNNVLVGRQVNQSGDSNIGSAQKDETNSNSASSLVTTLVPVLVIAVVWLSVFTFVRVKAGWKYSPRTSAKTLEQQAYSPKLSKSLLGWLPQLWKIPDTYVLAHQSLDSYLFLRFLKISVIICLVGCLITFPVLFPINITGGGTSEQLDIISMSNVVNPWKFFAHAGCAWIYFTFIMFLITRESIFYINLRQAYLMNPNYASKLSSRIVLFTAVPADYLDERKLRETLGDHVVRVWFPTETKKLDELVEERTKVAMKLEGAETKLIKLANAARLKSIKKGGAQTDQHFDAETAETTGSVAARWITPKQRPTHRLKFLIGKKVDTISWSREELVRLQPKIIEEQDRHRSGQATKVRSVFVEFDSLREAQAAYQSLTHHQVLTMAPRYTGVQPLDVVWGNLKIKGWERFIRLTATIAVVVATIVFWSIPVAVVGAISNINYLVEKLPWLGFINDLPSVLLGLITGLLPVVLLALLMSLLPPYLRLLARIGGAPTYSDIEYTVQNYYFGFQVVQVFLVATLGSAASASIQKIINNPGSTTSLLSTSLPLASNFYLSYFILQGLGVFAGLLVGIAGLIITPILVMILGSTPRKIFTKWNHLASIQMGTVFPIYTNLLIIAICYSCIAPLVLIFAAIGLFLFYFAYRYNILYVYELGTDTKGAVYPRALQQLFVGLYIAELCLVGLFATRLSNVGALGPFILMIILLIITILYNIALNSALSPLIKYLPKTLDAEEHRGLLTEEEKIESAHRRGELTAEEKLDADGEHENEKYGNSSTSRPISSTKPGHTSAPHKKPNFITKFLKPHIYNDYATMRRLVPNIVPQDEVMDEGLIRDAYLPPSVWAEVPQLAIPRDEMGVSAQEVSHTRHIIPITDESATLNEKNKIVVNDDVMSALYFEDKSRRMRIH